MSQSSGEAYWPGFLCAHCRGSRDEFFVDDTDLGELTAVTISHDGSGTSPAWHLDHVEVTPTPSSRPTTPAGFNSSNTPQWPADASGQPCSARRMSASSPTAGMRASLGAVQQQLRTSNSGGRGSPVPFSQSRVVFPCNAWLDETLGGGLTKRRLPAARWETHRVILWLSAYMPGLQTRRQCKSFA
jgi:hypothetical protein